MEASSESPVDTSTSEMSIEEKQEGYLNSCMLIKGRITGWFLFGNKTNSTTNFMYFNSWLSWFILVDQNICCKQNYCCWKKYFVIIIYIFVFKFLKTFKWKCVKF